MRFNVQNNKIIYSSKHSIILFIFRSLIIYELIPESLIKFTPPIILVYHQRIKLLELAKDDIDELVGFKMGIFWINFKYTNSYSLKYRPFSFSNPLCAHFPNIRTFFINNQIPWLINLRFSHFPLERWSIPASPIFVSPE